MRLTTATKVHDQPSERIHYIYEFESGMIHDAT